LAQRIAIVGAGYAGMAAAASLAVRGVPITIYEAGAVLGGRARRITHREHRLDNGQHILVGAYAELARMMEMVGVPSDAVLRMPL
jgi:predicted NAD/FAD-binding protein